MNRQAARAQFLAQTEWGAAVIKPLAGDASARCYFRLSLNGKRAVLMDAPPVDGADIAPFLKITQLLAGYDLSPPQIYASNQTQGFILMEDLGDALYAALIAQDPTQERPLYLAAVDVLAKIDAQPRVPDLPTFTPQVMSEQIAPLYDWYRKALVRDAGEAQKQAFQGALETILHDTLDPTSTLLLRDFHAENLIWLPGRNGLRRVGLLDYQDAMMGPAGYDLVSMLQDARRDVSATIAAEALDHFITQTGRDRAAFETAYAVIGLQRNLRILGIFVRLCQLHGKPRYIDFIPRVWGYVQGSLRHPKLAGLARMISTDIPAPDADALERLKALCPTP